MMHVPGKSHVIRQNAWVVADLEAAMRPWIEVHGVGPFHVFENLAIDGTFYRGDHAPIEISVAFAQCGGVQIELIQQLNHGPSAYRELVPEAGTGFHHIGIYTRDFETDRAAFEAAGYAIVGEGGSVDGANHYVYYDTRSHNGVFTELVKEGPQIQAIHSLVEESARNWDRTDPVRRVKLDKDSFALPANA